MLSDLLPSHSKLTVLSFSRYCFYYVSRHSVYLSVYQNYVSSQTALQFGIEEYITVTSLFQSNNQINNPLIIIYSVYLSVYQNYVSSQTSIEFLVSLVTVMFFVMFVMDVYHFQFRRSTIVTIMEKVDSLSNNIVAYILGAMASAGINNPWFPIWALALVNLRDNLHYISGCSIMEMEVRDASLIISLLLDIMNMNRLELANPNHWLLIILQLRCLYRSFAHQWARKSLWHGRSSEFLPDYLHRAVDNQHNRSNSSNNTRKHLVYGESDQKTNIMRPHYVLQLDETNPDSLITLEKIWESSGPLLNSSNSCRYKDMSLAFALSRLLRCRLEDVPLHLESIPITRHLITSEIIGGQDAEPNVEAEQAARRAFRILELEIAFVRDYFYTSYPMVFWRGLFSLHCILLQSIVTFVIAFWLAVAISKINDDYCDCNLQIIITWIFWVFIMFKEVWETVTYLLSKWTRILLVCKYVSSQCWCLGNVTLTKYLTRLCFTSKIVDPWHGRIDQYQFLHSCTYKPTFWKLAHTVTLGVTPEKFDGKKSGSAIKVPECIKAAVLQELCRLDLSNLTTQLPTDLLKSKVAGRPLPRDSLNKFAKYEWVFQLQTCSQVILVWHIATSLCEIKLALDNDIELSNPGILRSVWSCLRKQGSCSSQPFLVNENILQKGQLQTNYRIANSLSRYCAYLQAFQSELIPDSCFVPRMVFEKTLQYACEKLKDCDSMQSRYDKLKKMAQEKVQDSEDGKLNMNIVEQGSILANDLIEEEDEVNRWEILAGVWVGLVVHIAPSWNAEAHKHNLQSGGEFITLIWALLWHSGIEKSNLWHEGNAYKRNAQPPEEHSTETRNTQFVQERASENGIVTSEVPETCNIGTDIAEQAQRENEAKNNIPQVGENSSETRNIQFIQEQANGDGTETSNREPATSNFSIERTEQPQNETEINNKESQENSSETRNPAFAQAEAYEDGIETYDESERSN